MEEYSIEVTKREVIGKQVKGLRRAGQTPAILYGPNLDPIPIAMDTRVAERVLADVSSSSMINIVVDGKAYPTLVRERQRDIISGRLLHVDFQVVSLTELVRTTVNLVLEGEALAVSEKEGVLVPGLDSVDVEGYPQDLPSRIVVDLSVLEEVGDTIYVRDLSVPPKVTILNEPDEMVVLVTAQSYEELPEEVEEVVVEGEEPEIIGRGRREEAEAEEEAEADEA